MQTQIQRTVNQIYSLVMSYRKVNTTQVEK